MTCLNLTMPNQTVKNSLKAKKIELPQMNFVLEKLIKFSCTYQPLSICKSFIKKILELIQGYEDVRHFWDRNSPFALNKNFCGYKPLLLLSSTYGPFHCAKFKRNLEEKEWIQNYNDAPFLGPSGPFTSNNFFLFQKTC